MGDRLTPKGVGVNHEDVTCEQHPRRHQKGVVPTLHAATHSVRGTRPKKDLKGFRLPRERMTPEREFYKTILEILVEMGGQGKTEKVLEKVGAKMAVGIRVAATLLWSCAARTASLPARVGQ
jgi:hypothetical protein